MLRNVFKSSAKSCDITPSIPIPFLLYPAFSLSRVAGSVLQVLQVSVGDLITTNTTTNIQHRILCVK